MKLLILASSAYGLHLSLEEMLTGEIEKFGKIYHGLEWDQGVVRYLKILQNSSEEIARCLEYLSVKEEYLANLLLHQDSSDTIEYAGIVGRTIENYWRLDGFKEGGFRSEKIITVRDNKPELLRKMKAFLSDYTDKSEYTGHLLQIQQDIHYALLCVERVNNRLQDYKTENVGNLKKIYQDYRDETERVAEQINQLSSDKTKHLGNLIKTLQDYIDKKEYRGYLSKISEDYMKTREDVGEANSYFKDYQDYSEIGADKIFQGYKDVREHLEFIRKIIEDSTDPKEHGEKMTKISQDYWGLREHAKKLLKILQDGEGEAEHMGHLDKMLQRIL